MVKMRIVFLVFIVAALAPFIAKAATFQETLNQYIFDLQKNPNDNALREKIIKHVQEMEPKPAIPVEAEKFEGRAEFAIKSAKSEADFLDAAKEYEKALQIAPWMPAYYFNLGIAYEKGGKPKEAKRSFEFYLLAAPTASDAREVRKRIAGLEDGKRAK
jgi:tetratricopeptide (TPR) repeat protein